MLCRFCGTPVEESVCAEVPGSLSDPNHTVTLQHKTEEGYVGLSTRKLWEKIKLHILSNTISLLAGSLVLMMSSTQEK